MSKRKALKREVAKDVANALVVGAVGAAATVVPGHAAAAAVVGGAARLFGLVVSWRETRVQRRWEGFAEAYFEGVDPMDPALVEATLQAHADKPEVQEVVIEGARAIEDVLSDAVVPVLARLTRTYQMNGRGGDWFFRGLRRTLTDLSDEEFVALREFTQRVCGLGMEGPEGFVRIVHMALAAGEQEQLTHSFKLTGPEAKALGTDREDVGLGPLPHARRIFHVLKTNGLAQDDSSGAWGSFTGPQVIIVDVRVLGRILALVAG